MVFNASFNIISVTVISMAILKCPLQLYIFLMIYVFYVFVKIIDVEDNTLKNNFTVN